MNDEKYYIDKFGDEIGKQKYKVYIEWKIRDLKRRENPDYIKQRNAKSAEIKRRNRYRYKKEIPCPGLSHKQRWKSYSKDYKSIENYEQAKKDNFKGWHCHHRLELHPDGSVRFTRESLIKLDLYINRPANELIFLRADEHNKLHGVNRWK